MADEEEVVPAVEAEPTTEAGVEPAIESTEESV